LNHSIMARIVWLRTMRAGLRARGAEGGEEPNPGASRRGAVLHEFLIPLPCRRSQEADNIGVQAERQLLLHGPDRRGLRKRAIFPKLLGQFPGGSERVEWRASGKPGRVFFSERRLLVSTSRACYFRWTSFFRGRKEGRCGSFQRPLLFRARNNANDSYPVLKFLPNVGGATRNRKMPAPGPGRGLASGVLRPPGLSCSRNHRVGVRQNRMASSTLHTPNAFRARFRPAPLLVCGYPREPEPICLLLLTHKW